MEEREDKASLQTQGGEGQIRERTEGWLGGYGRKMMERMGEEYNGGREGGSKKEENVCKL